MSDLAAKLALRRQGISGPKAGGAKRNHNYFFLIKCNFEELGRALIVFWTVRRVSFQSLSSFYFSLIIVTQYNWVFMTM